MTSKSLPLPKVNLIGTPVTASPFKEQISTIIEWATDRASRFVCVANVHMVMEAYWGNDFRSVLGSADIVTPDGMPLVWMLRLLGFRKQDRVCGIDILLAVCKAAEEQKIKLFFLGATQEILDKLQVRLIREFPNLEIAGLEPLPFRPLTDSEDEELVKKINSTHAGIVFVALGCPKQELWMMQHKNRINAVMIGVGAVFPVYAGIFKRAPLWIRESGFEWLYRLLQEPRRLWGRYGKTIPPFIFLATRQLLHQRTTQKL
jgi:N-acetylglucosaminyldiphosphoundecaprenol N-acetyl-beta-D-mannosaminyltransferase